MSTVVDMAPVVAAGVRRPRRRVPGWVTLFAGGAALWVATVLTTFVTGNVNLCRRSSFSGAFWFR